MPRVTFAGHPLHAQLVELPTGLIPASLALDIAYLTTGKRQYKDAAYYTLLGGYAGAAAAALPGAGDYFAIPGGTPAKRVANTHLLLNIGVIALAGFNLIRRTGKKSIDPADVALSAAGTLALAVSAWYGAQMVYRHGVRVEGGAPVAEAEWRLPGDEQIEHALAGVPDALAAEREPEFAEREPAYSEFASRRY